MLFTPTKIKGVYIIEIEKIEDERGFFARTWDLDEFTKMGLQDNVAQCSISNNNKKGTLRGLHYQLPPYEETKIVRCTRGKLYDVVVDLRINSETYKQWISIELGENIYKMIFVAEGCAHGYQTLEDNTSVVYQMSSVYQPRFYRGVRWNDPSFKIRWPLDITAISKNDQNWPDFISYP